MQSESLLMLPETSAWYLRVKTQTDIKPRKFGRALWVIFLLTLPLVNPLLRGDGVGYYAYVRSVLIQHNLRFENDWINSPWPFVHRTVGANGRIGDPYTDTGHLPNHFSVGPAMLWAPFLACVHAVMVTLGWAGVAVKTDGFSMPYLLTSALATALYGFVGLYVSFCIARLFVADVWAFLATLGIWFASSLPVYLYFNPFYSHAHSVFAAAIFFWYWHRTRPERSAAKWAILGMLAGLILNVYYLNVAFLLLPALESLRRYWLAWRGPARRGEMVRTLLVGNFLFGCAAVLAFLPTLITRRIIYGNPIEFGYDPSSWTHPALWQPLLSSNHGLLSWTPIAMPSLAGLFLLHRYDRGLAAYSIATFAALYYIVACHPDWHGLSSFGNRFFISLTPLFIVGLAVFLREASRWFNRPRMAIAASVVVMGALMLWNLAFIFQWGTGLVPHVGPISWTRMAHNQFTVVPGKLGGDLKTYFVHRRAMMQRIELEDLKRMRGE